MKKHVIDHILHTGRFSLENIKYSASFILSNKANFYMKTKNKTNHWPLKVSALDT